MPFSCLLLCSVVSFVNPFNHSLIHCFRFTVFHSSIVFWFCFTLIYFTLLSIQCLYYFMSFHFISYTVNSFYHLDLCVWSNTLQDQNRSCKKMRLALLPLLANKVPAWHRIQVNFKEHLWSVATKKQVCTVNLCESIIVHHFVVFDWWCMNFHWCSLAWRFLLDNWTHNREPQTAANHRLEGWSLKTSIAS